MSKDKKTLGYQALTGDSKPPFLLHIFPELIQEIIHKSVETYNFPLEITASGILSAVGYALGNKFRFITPMKWIAKPIIWMCVVAPRGTSKTHAINKALKPLNDAVNEKYKRYKEELSHWKQSGKKVNMPYFVSPVISESTVEGIIMALEKNPHGVLTHSDELETLMGNFSRYSQGNDTGPYNTLWNGTSYSYNRKNAALNVHIEDPFWSLIGGIQPTRLTGVFKPEMIESGFFDRMQFVFPYDTDYKHFNLSLQDNGLDNMWSQYNQRMTDFMLRSLDSTSIRAGNEELWTMYYNIIGDTTNGLDDNDPRRGLAMKGQTMFARWGLILHGLNVIFNGKSIREELTDEEIRAASELTMYFFQSGLIAYNIVQNSSPVDKLNVKQRNFYESIPDFPLKRDALIDYGEKSGMARATVDRFLRKRELFKKTQFGEYIKRH